MEHVEATNMKLKKWKGVGLSPHALTLDLRVRGLFLNSGPLAI